MTDNTATELVFKTIVNLANGDKCQNISVNKILEETKLDEKTLIRILESLEKETLITISHRFLSGIDIHSVRITLIGIERTINPVLIKSVLETITNMGNDKNQPIHPQIVLEKTNLNEKTLINILEILEKNYLIRISNNFINGIDASTVIYIR